MGLSDFVLVLVSVAIGFVLGQIVTDQGIFNSCATQHGATLSKGLVIQCEIMPK